jgi:hypothetical protein
MNGLVSLLIRRRSNAMPNQTDCVDISWSSIHSKENENCSAVTEFLHDSIDCMVLSAQLLLLIVWVWESCRRRWFACCRLVWNQSILYYCRYEYGKTTDNRNQHNASWATRYDKVSGSEQRTTMECNSGLEHSCGHAILYLKNTEDSHNNQQSGGKLSWRAT